MRHGCRSLVQFEILPMPPMQRAAGQSLAAVAQGLQARLRPGRSGKRSSATTRGCTSIQTTKFVGDAAGAVKEIHTVRVEWVKDNGRPMPKNVPGSEQVFPAQLLLLALGFLGPENQLLDQLGVEKDRAHQREGGVRQFATSVPGVFAAGDMRRGQSLVVWAINEGRGAARECDRFLMGKTDLP